MFEDKKLPTLHAVEEKRSDPNNEICRNNLPYFKEANTDLRFAQHPASGLFHDPDGFSTNPPVLFL